MQPSCQNNRRGLEGSIVSCGMQLWQEFVTLQRDELHCNWNQECDDFATGRERGG